MAEFVTISLESNECDICHQDNGEELISYILNDRCWREQEMWSRTSKSCDDQIRRAHTLCLDRWDHIMKKSFNRFNLLRRSWTGKQNRFLAKASSNSLENLNITRTWTVINTKSHSEENVSSFTKEKGLVAHSEQTTINTYSPLVINTEERKGDNSGNDRLKENLARTTIKDLKERISCYSKKIKDASTQLIDLLQERDALRQEIEVQHVAIEQLLKLQTGGNRSQSKTTRTGLSVSLRTSLRV